MGETDYSKYFKFNVRNGAILAIVQSIAWIIMTSICIAEYYTCPTLKTSIKMSEAFLWLMKFLYFNDNEKCLIVVDNPKLMVRPYNMLIWNFIYLNLSLLWLLFSITVLVQIKRKETIHKKYKFAYPWIVCTFIVSILDIILGSFLGADILYYQSLPLFEVNQTINVTAFLFMIVTGVMMAIVMRGFILCVINLVFAVYAVFGIIDIRKAIKEDNNTPTQHNTLARGPISAYDDTIEARSARWLAGEGHMNRPHLVTPKTPNMYGRSESYQGEVNRGYMGSNGSLSGHRLAPPPVYPTSATGLKPWERDMPTTPRPDYSPQPIRAMRSALKPVQPPYVNGYNR